MKKQVMNLTLILLASSALCAMAENQSRGECPDGGKMRERMLKHFDEDGDGKLSESEKAAMETARTERTKRLDTDGDGKLSKAERQAGRDKMLKRFDTDGDGKVSEKEREAARYGKGKRPAQT